jgi:hypothetical protein
MSRDEETLQQRRSRYLRMAKESARLSATGKNSELREVGLRVADSWLKLASESGK